MKPLRKAGLIFDWVIDLVFYFICVLLVLAMLAVCLEVTARHFLNRPQAWVMATTEYILLYITFLGAAWVLRAEGHINMDLVLNLLKPVAREVLDIINSIIVVVICLAITWYSAQTTWRHFQEGVTSIKMLEVPVASIMVAIPIGSFLLFIQSLRRLYGYLRRWGASRCQEQKS